MALLLPDAQQTRETAKRISCKNNLKQSGLALHNYRDTHKMFPPRHIRGYSSVMTFEHGNGASWGALLLPFLKQAAFYDKLNFNIGIFEGTNKSTIMALREFPRSLPE